MIILWYTLDETLSRRLIPWVPMGSHVSQMGDRLSQMTKLVALAAGLVDSAVQVSTQEAASGDTR